MTSPVVPNGKVTLIKKINVNSIINSYKEELNIDISRFFNHLKEIDLYQCNESGYRFFTPLNSIFGDSEFYEELEKFDWYYMPWKWEHEVFLKEVDKSCKVLEIGSGGLGFIQKLDNLGYDIVGLELNEKSIKKAHELNLEVKPLFIESFAKQASGQFDVVCSFQVLEHICNVKEFLCASIHALKPGGKLIICVPNNESFIRFDKKHLMNYPPHHAGWWDTESLSSLERFFPIKLEKIFYEPLQEYHRQWFINLKIEKCFFSKFSYLRTFLNSYFSNYLDKNYLKIKGHSICVIYEKN